MLQLIAESLRSLLHSYLPDCERSYSSNNSSRSSSGQQLDLKAEDILRILRSYSDPHAPIDAQSRIMVLDAVQVRNVEVEN